MFEKRYLSETKPAEEVESVPRRKFLGCIKDIFIGGLRGLVLVKLINLGIDTTPVAVDLFEKKVGRDLTLEVFSYKLRIKLVKRLHDEYDIQLLENKNFRRLVHILSDSINLYGGKVSFAKSKNYLEDDEFFSLLDEGLPPISVKDLWNIFDGDYYARLKFGMVRNYLLDTFVSESDESVSPLEQSSYNFLTNGYLVNSILHLESGFSKRSRSSDDTEVLNVFFRDINFIKKQIDKHPNKPVSISFVLAEFLHLNNGDLSDSLTDMGIFLKLFSRSKFDSNSHEVFHVDRLNSHDDKQKEIKRICDWFVSSITDEYSLLGEKYNFDIARKLNLGLDSTDKDLSVINLVGGPYHIWNILALLKFYGPGTLSIATFGTQMFELTDERDTKGTQGYLKTANDIEALLQLDELDVFFNSFPKS